MVQTSTASNDTVDRPTPNCWDTSRKLAMFASYHNVSAILLAVGKCSHIKDCWCSNLGKKHPQVRPLSSLSFGNFESTYCHRIPRGQIWSTNLGNLGRPTIVLIPSSLSGHTIIYWQSMPANTYYALSHTTRIYFHVLERGNFTIYLLLYAAVWCKTDPVLNIACKTHCNKSFSRTSRLTIIRNLGERKQYTWRWKVSFPVHVHGQCKRV